MSIVYLSSNGQNPHNFTNQFAQGIQLGRGAEVSVMGYSGNLRNSVINADSPPTEMIIIEGSNDVFSVYHGDLREATSFKQSFYAPFLVKIRAGTYTPDALAEEIERVLGVYEYVDTFKNGWTCSWDATTNKFTIKCGSMRQPANGNGDWLCYTGEPDGVVAVNTLVPFTVAGNIKRESFLDLKTGFLGATTEALGTVTPGSQGYEINFTTTDTDYSKIQVSMGLVPETRASRCDRGESSEFTNSHHPTGAARDANFVWNGSKAVNGNIDFAMRANDTFEWVGFFTLGMVVGLDGNIGIIQSLVGVESNTPKSPTNRSIIWTATNIGAAGAKKLMMCPRYDTVNNYPVMEFLADVGAGYVVIQTVIIGGIDSNTNYYSDTVKQHYGVVFDPEYINAAMVNAYVVKSQHTDLAAGAAAEPNQPITLGWRALGYNDTLNTPIHESSGLTKLQEQTNISDYLGFKATEDTSTTPFTVGWISTEGITTSIELESVNQPLIITSRDLTAKGYMGAGAGGMGAEAAILGVVRTNGLAAQYGFSTDCPENWIHLNNTSPILLNSLNITLKDQMNIEGNILEADFNVWLKFRCDATQPCPPKHNLVVGGFNNTQY